MKGFIEVINYSQGMSQLVNLRNVQSFTKLDGKTLIHFDLRNAVTVKETYEEIKQLIKEAS